MGVRVAGRVLLAALLAATVWIAATSAPQRKPADGPETTNWLAAHSLAFDHDELFVDADAARFRAAFEVSPRGVLTDPHGGSLEAPYLATRAWGWAIALAGERGPFLLNALAFVLAAFAGSRALRVPFGAGAPVWMAVFLFASTAFTYVFRWQSEILVFAAVVLAGALVWGREAPEIIDRGPDQIFGGDLAARPALWPWPLAGLLLGLAVVRHPAYALLALPMLLDLRRAGRLDERVRWRLTAALFGLLLVLPLVFVAALHGASWEAPATTFHPALFGWNVLYLVVGSHAGVLVGFFPVVVLLLGPRREGGRGLLPVVVGLAALTQLLLSPFDWAGDLTGVGNPWFLPLFGALLLGAGPALRLRAAALVAAACLPVMAPYWIAPLSEGTRAPEFLAPFTSRLRERLPFETSLRDVPGSTEIVRAGVRLRATNPAIRPAGGRLALAGAVAAVLVESDRPLSSVRLDFSAEAPGSLTVEGGTDGSTTYRPSGEVSFEIVLGRPSRLHPLWWSRTPVSIYVLRLALPAVSRMPGEDPKAPPQPVTFDLGLARVAGPAIGRP